MVDALVWSWINDFGLNECREPNFIYGHTVIRFLLYYSTCPTNLPQQASLYEMKYCFVIHYGMGPVLQSGFQACIFYWER